VRDQSSWLLVPYGNPTAIHGPSVTYLNFISTTADAGNCLPV